MATQFCAYGGAKTSDRWAPSLRGSIAHVFTTAAKRRVKMGLKFNAELILLPDEMMRAKGKHFRIIVGEPIPYTELPPTKDRAAHFANHLRDTLYTFPQRYITRDSQIVYERQISYHQ